MTNPRIVREHAEADLASSTPSPELAGADVSLDVREEETEPASIAAGAGISRGHYLAIAALGLMSVIWGYAWVVMKVGLDYTEPMSFAAMRLVIAAVFLFGFLAILRRPLRPGSMWFVAIVGLLQTTGSAGMITWALQEGSAGKTAVLVYTMPLWLLLLSAIVLGDKLRGGLQWAAVALSLVGLCLILTPWDMSGSVLSNLLAVGSGITWAASTVVAKIFSRRHTLDILSLNAWQVLFGAIPLVVVALLTTDTAPHWTVAFVGTLLYSAVLSAAVGICLWFYAVRAVSAGTAGMASLATPVLGVGAAWIQLGEQPDLFEGIGMVLIVAGLCVLVVRQILGTRVGRVF